MKKIVKDGFGEVVNSNSSDKFKFYLYLTSESADLNTRTFNYEIVDDSGNKVSNGTYSLNPPENKSGKYKYRSQTPIELSSKQTLKLTGLPVGASYEVVENDYSSNGYSTSIGANTNIKETDNKDYQPTIDNANRKASGKISQAGDTITYTNSQQRITPTSADSMTRMSFWILGTAGALVLVLFLKRRLKASKI